MKKFFTIFIISITLLGLAGFSFAQDEGRSLEIEYPEVEGEKPETTTTQVPEYFKYIFNFLIWISGVVALGVLIYAGFQYFTSVGNPEAIRDAKDRIGAALLGLLILFGSYLILININPELVVFRLERLRPIISTLPAGVLLCKEEAPVERAWQITVDYKYKNPSIEQALKWKEELDGLLDDIALKCYTVISAGDIQADFDNKVQFIYFIPGPPAQKGGRIVLYGAVLYEERNYGGNSKTYGEHFQKAGVTIYDIEQKGPGELKNFQLSSIIPFKLTWPPDPNWEVTLYQEYNYNKDIAGAIEKSYSLGPAESPNSTYYSYSDIKTDFKGNSPKSMKIEGDLLVVLIARDSKTQDSKSEVFFNESDNNLEDNLNIVKEVACTDYKNQTIIKQDCRYVGVGAGPGGLEKIYEPCCAEAATTRIIIISAAPY